jgi:hypothetical protein
MLYLPGGNGNRPAHSWVALPRIHPKWLTEQNPEISGISVTVATAEVVVCKQADSNSSIDFQQRRL